MLLDAVSSISDGAWLDVVPGEDVVLRCSMTGTNGTARVVIEESHDQVGVANSITFPLSTGVVRTAAFRAAAIHLRARVIAIGGTTPAVTVSEKTLSGGGLQVNTQSAAYAILAGDANSCIFHPSADTTPRTWTIPANASVPFPVGTMITFDNDISAGALTIAITTDTLVLVGAAGSTGSRTLAAGGRATALKVTATRWRISGTAELS